MFISPKCIPLVEGIWSTWNAWSSCTGGQTTRSRTRSHTGGVLPCSGTDTESGPCCLNPTLTISYEECYSSCSSTDWAGRNVLTEYVPDTTSSQMWLGNGNATPQKIRIAFSCAKMISSASLRNSKTYNFASTQDFEIKVRKLGSNNWDAFVSGTLSNPYGLSTPPLETFSGAPVVIEEVEFTCLSIYTTSSTNYCALNYIEFN